VIRSLGIPRGFPTAGPCRFIKEAIPEFRFQKLWALHLSKNLAVDDRILVVIVITFMISRVLGDPVALLLPPEATPEQRMYYTRDLGLDRPMYVQLVVYVGKVLKGDFGQSFRHQEPAMKILLDRVPASLYLTLVATFISVCVALPLGIISAIKRGTIVDRIGMTLALFGQSIPAFWAGIMMILLFSVKLGWLPPSGYGGAKNVILPAVTLAFFFTAATARLTRSSIRCPVVDYVVYETEGMRRVSFCPCPA
jgi:peptide/nickel transport system permease protein